MNKGFVPFVVPATEGPATEPGAPAKVVTDAKSAMAFRPVTEGSIPPAPPAGGEPRVTLEREGDRVTRIKIQCCCGHSIELACDY